MIPVRLSFSVYVDPKLRARFYRRVVAYPAVPRVGDRIELTDGGWSEVVREVWWLYDGCVAIEFRPHVTDSAGPELLAAAEGLNAWNVYVSAEDLAALEPAGWEVI